MPIESAEVDVELIWQGRGFFKELTGLTYRFRCRTHSGRGKIRVDGVFTGAKLPSLNNEGWKQTLAELRSVIQDQMEDGLEVAPFRRQVVFDGVQAS